LQLLARRDYSTQELIHRLQAKAFDVSGIHHVLADLKQMGIINEQRFIENYIHWRRNKGYGPQRIHKELQARGLPHQLIAEHLHITDNAWLMEARKIWEKHFKGKQPSDFKSKAKQMRFLQYRGFTQEHIAAVILGNDFE
jgi:regulatory protein